MTLSQVGKFGPDAKEFFVHWTRKQWNRYYSDAVFAAERSLGRPLTFSERKLLVKAIRVREDRLGSSGVLGMFLSMAIEKPEHMSLLMWDGLMSDQLSPIGQQEEFEHDENEDLEGDAWDDAHDVDDDDEDEDEFTDYNPDFDDGSDDWDDEDWDDDEDDWDDYGTSYDLIEGETTGVDISEDNTTLGYAVEEDDEEETRKLDPIEGTE